MIDYQTPRSPGAWLVRLHRELTDRRRGGQGWNARRERRHLRPGLDLLDDYLRGDPPLPEISREWADIYVGLIREARTNYAELVVEAPRDRMIPMGWTTAADQDEGGDQEAAKMASANNLELRVSEAIRLFLAFGDAYMMAGPPRASLGGMPLFTEEDPRECITSEDPGTGETQAGLKLMRDDWTGDELAYVYLPGELHVARRGAGIGYGTSNGGWGWDAKLSSRYPDAFSDLVPIVRMRNRDGRGEFEPHLSLLDRINSETFRRVTVAMFQAYRQRAAIDLPETTDDLPPAQDGSNVIDYNEVFVSDPMSIWKLPAGTTMWESGAVDLSGIRAAAKDDVMQLAAVTITPLYSVVPDAANGSAEGATVLREGLAFRVKDRQRRIDFPLARLMSMGFRYLNDSQRSNPLAIKTIWQGEQLYSLTDRAQAASQLKGILPMDLIRRDILGYSPAELERIQQAVAAELLRAAQAAAIQQVLNPQLAPVPPVVPGDNQTPPPRVRAKPKPGAGRIGALDCDRDGDGICNEETLSPGRR